MTASDDPAGTPDTSGPVMFEITWTVTDSYTATFTAGALWQYLDGRERRLFGDDMARLDPAAVGHALVEQFADLENEHTHDGTGESRRSFVAARTVTPHP